MRTLIVPCAGKSTRFPNMKAKWLLTHPDGKLMLEKAISRLPLPLFNRIIITIVREQDMRYDAIAIIRQAFSHIKNLEICVLDNYTKSPAETIALTLEKMQVTGPFVTKDSDNCVELPVQFVDHPNFIVGLNLNVFGDVSYLSGKSFLLVNNDGNIQDIIEKKITSERICLGIYGFESVEAFFTAYHALQNTSQHELFQSHLISYLINQKNFVFRYVETTHFEDWATLRDWANVQRAHRVFFIHIDGVLVKNSTKFGIQNWANTYEVIEENVNLLKKMVDDGVQLVLTTSRTEEHREKLTLLFKKANLNFHTMIMGLHHSGHVIVKNFETNDPFPTCEAFNIANNTLLSEYLAIK